jgi:hypothetical protein
VRAPGELVAAVAGGEAFAVAPTPGHLSLVTGIETVSMISDDVPLRLLVIRRPEAQRPPIDSLESALWKLSR